VSLLTLFSSFPRTVLVDFFALRHSKGLRVNRGTKDEVSGSNPDSSSKKNPEKQGFF